MFDHPKDFPEFWTVLILTLGALNATLYAGGRLLEREKRIQRTVIFGVGIPLLLMFLLGFPRSWLFVFIYGLYYAAAQFFSGVRLWEAHTSADAQSHDSYEALREQRTHAAFPPESEFCDAFFSEFEKRCASEGLARPNRKLYEPILVELYTSDFVQDPSIGVLGWSEEHVHVLLDFIDRDDNIGRPHLISELLKERFAKPEAAIQVFKGALIDVFLVFMRATPHDSSPIKAPAATVLSKQAMQDMVSTFIRIPYRQKFLAHTNLYFQLWKNWDEVSREHFGKREFEQGERILPAGYPGSSFEAAAVFFARTPFIKLLAAPMPLPLSDKTRFEHQWVIATPGSGKTQLLQTQIAADLKRVEAGQASIIVIDSQPLNKGGLLSNIATLKQFAPGQALDGKLVFIRPDMSEEGSQEIVSPALNVFDVGQHDEGLSARDQTILQGAALNMIGFTLSGTTPQQDAMIRFLVQLGVNIPGATLHTIRRMLIMKKPEFLSTYADALGRVSEVVRDYFTHSFFDDAVRVTREAVSRRFMELMSDTTFERMFSNERNAINLRREIDAGKVILVHTDKALLLPDRCEIFGRFFISLILQATLQRTSTKPVFCYIDECADYIANDENVATAIDQARKQHVGFILSHQRLSQVRSKNVLTALASCAVKFASRNEGDSGEVAGYLRASEEFLRDMPKLSFACHIREVTKQGAIKIDVKPGLMEDRMEHMTEEEYAAVRQRMRDLYCGSPTSSDAPPASPPTPLPPRRGEVTDVSWEDVV